MSDECIQEEGEPEDGGGSEDDCPRGVEEGRGSERDEGDARDGDEDEIRPRDARGETGEACR